MRRRETERGRSDSLAALVPPDRSPRPETGSGPGNGRRGHSPMGDGDSPRNLGRQGTFPGRWGQSPDWEEDGNLFGSGMSVANERPNQV